MTTGLKSLQTQNEKDAIVMQPKDTIVVGSGSEYRIRNDADMQIYRDLPVGTYTVGFDQRAEEFFLTRIPGFELPNKIYGKNTNYAGRILSTFEKRPLSTGVLLNGIKGAGKTLLAKQTAVMAAEKGIPTIVINRDWNGDKFNSFIQSIQCPAIILFDEFEKVYGYVEQRKILTLLDGVFPTKKLFLLTTNTEREVSEFLRNRPGRIYYTFSFETLGQEFIQEYLEDRLDNKSYIDDILTYTKVFSFFNFDMLAAVVEEMNRYGETLQEVLEVLNIIPENVSTDTYTMTLSMNGVDTVLDRTYRGFQPNSFEYTIWTDGDMPGGIKDDSAEAALLRSLSTVSDDEYCDDDCIVFTPNLIESFDSQSNTFTYVIERNQAKVSLTVKRNDHVEKWKYNPNAF